MAKKNKRTTNQNLKDEYKRRYASSKEIDKASKSDMSRASSMIPASALYESIRRNEKRLKNKGESAKNLEPIKGIIDWTGCSTQGWDLLTSQPSTFTGLLDTYGGAAAAYSLRKLSSTYTGDAIRVRESGGDTEADIGFDDNGDLDTTALLAHCGANDGYVTTWYDQSGNGVNVSNSNATQQPTIVNSGALATQNGKPAIDWGFQQSTILLRTSSATVVGDTNGMSAFSVSWQDSDSATSAAPIFDSYDNSDRIIYTGVDSSVDLYAGVHGNDPILSPNILSNYTLLSQTSTSSGDGEIYLNGSLIGSDSAYTGDARLITIGTTRTGIGQANTHSGNIQEVIFYANDNVSNRESIESNINNYYSIW